LFLFLFLSSTVFNSCLVSCFLLFSMVFICPHCFVRVYLNVSFNLVLSSVLCSICSRPCFHLFWTVFICLHCCLLVGTRRRFQCGVVLLDCRFFSTRVSSFLSVRFH
jgi:hypothetical protein